MYEYSSSLIALVCLKLKKKLANCTLGYWQFNLDGVKVNGTSVDGSSVAISDTGTAVIVGPQDAVRAIVSALGGKFNVQQGLVSKLQFHIENMLAKS